MPASIETANMFNYMAAREDFVVWLHTMWPQVGTQSDYIISRVHEYLADVVQDVLMDRNYSGSTISMPPQHGKSRLVCVRMVAWCLGRFPNISIAITGFSHQLLCEFIDEVQSIVRSDRYRRIFKNIRPLPKNNRADYKRYTNGACLVAKSSGSKLTGRRVDLLIVDDAHAGRAEAESPAQRRKVVQWYSADCMSRLSNNAKVFVVGTRWHPDDLIGSITTPDYLDELEDTPETKGMQYRIVNLPAIADHDPSRGETDPIGRNPGEALFPEDRPLEFLLKQKNSREMSSYDWDSLYQGKPQSSMSGEVDLDKIKYVDYDEVPWESLDKVRGWDIACTESQLADYTAGALCGWDAENERFYLLDMFRERMAWAKLKEKMFAITHTDRNDRDREVMRIGIEGVSGFKIVFDEVKRQFTGDVRVEKRNPAKGGKLLRAQPWLNLVEGGQFVMVRNRRWNREFTSELGQFPDGKHDDMVDAVSVAYECLCKRTRVLS